MLVFFGDIFGKLIFLTIFREVRTSRDTSARGKAKVERGGRSDAGQKRGSNLVQSQGVFSEGSAAATVKKTTGTRSYSSREGGASEALIRPVINKAEVKVDPEVESRQIREILGDDSSEEDKTTDDGDKLMPISVEDCKKLFFLIHEILKGIFQTNILNER